MKSEFGTVARPLISRRLSQDQVLSFFSAPLPCPDIGLTMCVSLSERQHEGIVCNCTAMSINWKCGLLTSNIQTIFNAILLQFDCGKDTKPCDLTKKKASILHHLQEQKYHNGKYTVHNLPTWGGIQDYYQKLKPLKNGKRS